MFKFFVESELNIAHSGGFHNYYFQSIPLVDYSYSVLYKYFVTFLQLDSIYSILSPLVML